MQSTTGERERGNYLTTKSVLQISESWTLTIVLVLIIALGSHLRYIEFADINAYIYFTIFGFIIIAASASLSDVRPSLAAAWRAVFPYQLFAIYLVGQTFILPETRAVPQPNLIVIFLILAVSFVAYAVARLQSLGHDAIWTALFSFYAMCAISAFLLIGQIWVSLKVFDIVPYFNQIGISRVKDVFVFNDLSSVIANRGRGLAATVHTFAGMNVAGAIIGIFYWKRSRFIRGTLWALIIAGILNSAETAIVPSLFAYFLLNYRGSKGSWRFVIAISIVVFVSVVAAVLYYSWLPSASDAIGNTSNSFTSRLIAYDRALDMFVHHPIMGVGGGQFKVLIQDYRGIIFPLPGVFLDQNPHSVLFELLSETGLIGTLLWMPLLIYELAFRKRPTAHNSRTLWVMTCGAFISAFMTNDMTLMTIYLLYCLLRLSRDPQVQSAQRT